MCVFSGFSNNCLCNRSNHSGRPSPGNYPALPSPPILPSYVRTFQTRFYQILPPLAANKTWHFQVLPSTSPAKTKTKTKTKIKTKIKTKTKTVLPSTSPASASRVKLCCATTHFFCIIWGGKVLEELRSIDTTPLGKMIS